LESFLGEARSDEPDAPRALALLVRAHEMQGQRGQALAAAETFLARYPRHALASELQLRRGYILLLEQKYPAAQPALEAARDTGEPAVAAPAHVYLGELHRAAGDHETAVAAYLGATYLYGDTLWAARGLQGAAQSYLSQNRPREAGIVLRKLAARDGLEPAMRDWARQALATLGPVTGEDPGQALRKGTPAKP
ncbi:MAG: tetratricopeptide repeat protein, partial [Candidatus Rokuibacteriota bacterium]